MKNMAYLVVGLLLISGFAAISIGEEASIQRETISITFFEPNIVEKETYIELELEGTDNLIFDGGNPLLPVRTETITLPFGVTITDVRCEVEGVQTKVLSKKIIPAPQPTILSERIEVSSEPLINQELYESEKMYPDNWFSYDVGVGLGKNNEHVTFLTIRTFPVRYNPGEDTIYYAESFDVTYAYKLPESKLFPTNFEDEYKLVIIAPNKFSSLLDPLVTHKESMGLSTILKTTEQIYADYDGYDKPEQIKYFIKDAIETWNTSYVMLVGGLKSLIYAVPRDDSSQGTKGWNLPVRYSNMAIDDDPGYLSDLYFSDIYQEGGVFCSWDSNENHIYGEYKFNGDNLDLYPDVAVGRLPCRTIQEVKDAVEKIKTYETSCDPQWFEKVVAISGDGFLDQVPFNILWPTTGLPTGQYTIYAQSKNINDVYGPIDKIQVTLDKTKATSIKFNHDDHLTTGLSYPFKPVAEIVTVSEGDVLGNSNYAYTPKEWEAYCNNHYGWANIQYNNGILKIGGKTYDPRPYGVNTTLHVWINNSGGSTVYDITKTGFSMYWEGEWCTGEVLLHDRAGGLYYMPESFDKLLIWTSNGNFTGMEDVMDVLDEGCGFAYFSGHGSPDIWADHYPGVPGNRNNGGADGLYVFNYNGFPFFPMGKLKNNFKNPVVVVGGCHNSMFNVSLIPTLLDKDNSKRTHCYGLPTPECWSERLVNVGQRGAIASIGNTGYGYGILGEWCTVGGYDGYITTEFFVQYGTNGYDILGETHAQTITEYLLHFDPEWDSTHQKTIEQWVLLGDPSLQLGGY